MKAKASDKYQLITDKLITLIENGTKPWVKPWHSAPYQNLVSGHVYTGKNPLFCSIDMIFHDYKTPFFVGFNQAKKNQWQVKKGSKASWLRWGATVVKEAKESQTEAGESRKQSHNYFKWLQLFNIDCIDDANSEIKLADLISQRQPPALPNPDQRIANAENFIARCNPVVQFGGDRACYVPALDTIRLPNYQDFSSAITYYATHLHELVHWTGHETRVNRQIVNGFCTSEYAYEELVAELGAALLCNELGIESDLEHHASYLDCWLKLLEQDNLAFFKAATEAVQAIEFLKGN